MNRTITVLVSVILIVLAAIIMFGAIRAGKSVGERAIYVAECPSSCDGICLSVDKARMSREGDFLVIRLEKLSVQRYGNPSEVSLHYLSGDRLFYLGCSTKGDELDGCEKIYLPMEKFYERRDMVRADMSKVPEGIIEIRGMYFAFPEEGGERRLRMFLRNGYIDVPLDRLANEIIDRMREFNFGGCGMEPSECCRMSIARSYINRWLMDNMERVNVSEMEGNGELRIFADANDFPPWIRIHVLYNDKKGRTNRGEMTIRFEPVDCLSVNSESDFKEGLDRPNNVMLVTLSTEPEFSERGNLPYYLSTIADNRLFIYLMYGKCRECRSEHCMSGNVKDGNEDICGCTLNRISGTGLCGRNCAVPVDIDYSALARVVLER